MGRGDIERQLPALCAPQTQPGEGMAWLSTTGWGQDRALNALGTAKVTPALATRLAGLFLGLMRGTLTPKRGYCTSYIHPCRPPKVHIHPKAHPGAPTPCTAQGGCGREVAEHDVTHGSAVGGHPLPPALGTATRGCPAPVPARPPGCATQTAAAPRPGRCRALPSRGLCPGAASCRGSGRAPGAPGMRHPSRAPSSGQNRAGQKRAGPPTPSPAQKPGL